MSRLDSAVLVRVSRAEHNALRKLSSKGMIVAQWIRGLILDGLSREGVSIDPVPEADDDRQFKLGFPAKYLAAMAVELAQPMPRKRRQRDPFAGIEPLRSRSKSKKKKSAKRVAKKAGKRRGKRGR